MNQRNFLFLALYLGAASLAAQSQTTKDTTIIRSMAYSFEIRPAIENSNALGVDYDVRYEVIRQRAINNPEGHHFNFNLSAKGFQDFAQNVQELNHTKIEARLEGQYYSSGLKPLSPQQQTLHTLLSDILEEFSNQDTASLSDEARAKLREKTQGAQNELQKLTARSAASRFFMYNGHYLLETTQEFTMKQHAVGVGITGEIPFLHHMLDLIIAGFAPRQLPYEVQPVRMHLGVDYITKRESPFLMSTGETPKGFSRTRLEVAWKTKMLDSVILRATWELEYIFNPPADLKKSKRELNSFLQVWLEHPLSDKFAVLAKFVEGRLPPLYANTSEGTIGLRFSLK